MEEKEPSLVWDMWSANFVFAQGSTVFQKYMRVNVKSYYLLPGSEKDLLTNLVCERHAET